MRRIALLILLPVLFLAPFSASAATVNFFGPIVPEECNCLPSETGGLPSAPDWGCVLATIQNLVSFAISIGVIIVVFMVAYAGILWIASPFNPHNREEGRNLLLGSVIGLVIVLCSWLLVDFVMKFFYNETRAKDYAGYEEISYLPWESILGGNTESVCLERRELPVGGGGQTPIGPSTPSDGAFTYQTGISAQASHASPELNTLLSCMAQRVPGNVGQISSISDSRIVSGSKTFEQCADGGRNAGCAHQVNSCHYGGQTCRGKSYAVDFGDEQNKEALMSAARACGASLVLDEGNHIHVSVGGACGCDG